MERERSGFRRSFFARSSKRHDGQDHRADTRRSGRVPDGPADVERDRYHQVHEQQAQREGQVRRRFGPAPEDEDAAAQPDRGGDLADERENCQQEQTDDPQRDREHQEHRYDRRDGQDGERENADREADPAFLVHPLDGELLVPTAERQQDRADDECGNGPVEPANYRAQGESGAVGVFIFVDDLVVDDLARDVIRGARRELGARRVGQVALDPGALAEADRVGLEFEVLADRSLDPGLSGRELDAAVNTAQVNKVGRKNK